MNGPGKIEDVSEIEDNSGKWTKWRATFESHKRETGKSMPWYVV